MKQHVRKGLALVSALVILTGLLLPSAFATMAGDSDAVITYDKEILADAYSSVSDATAFHRSDVGKLKDSSTGAVTYQAYRFSDNTATAGWAVYDAGVPVKQFQVSGYIISGQDATQLLTFSVSNDQVNWESVTTTVEAGTGTNHTYWLQQVYTGETAETFQYLRVDFAAVSAYSPGLHYIKMATYVPPKAESYAKKVQASEGTATGEGGEFALVVGSEYYTFTDGNKTTAGNRYSGTVTFKSDYPITDYNFATLVSKVGWGGTVSFQASKDGEAWDDLTCTTVSTGDYGGTDWNGTYNDNYGSLDAADGYLYLRAVISANSDNLPLPRFPAVAYVQYNCDMVVPDSYEVKVAGKDGAADSIGDTVLYTFSMSGGDEGGYTAFNSVENGVSTGNSAEGNITFKSNGPITDFHIHMAKSTVGFAHTIEISKDGTVWEEAVLFEKEGAVYANTGWAAQFTDYYGTLSAEDGYCYIRISLSENAYKVEVPALGYVEYNQQYEPPAYEIPESYLVKQTAKDGVAAGETGGTLVVPNYQTSLLGEYAVFKLPDNLETHETVAGTVTFTSMFPITDLHVHMVQADTAATVELSKDGATWETLELIEIEGNVFKPTWAASYFTDYYTTLTAADGYYHIRVNMPAHTLQVPALGYVEYNYDLKLPDSYEVKQPAAKGSAAGENESTLVTKNLVGGQDSGYAVFKKVENGEVTDTGATGTITFCSEYPITDFHIHMLQCTLNGYAATFEISKDAAAWEKITPAEVPGEAYGNNSWKAYYTDYYGTLSADAGYQYIRVTLPANAWGLETPSLGYVEYTREGEPVILPVEYDVKRKATQYESISDATLFKKADSGIPSYNEERPYRFSTGAVNTGWVVYYATANATHFRVNAYLASTLQTAVDLLSFEVSTDLKTWIPVTAEAEVIGVKWPTCLYTYGSTTAFRYVKVIFNGSASKYDPGVYSVDFATDGDYDPNVKDDNNQVEQEDAPVEGSLPESPDIADLKLKSQTTVFSEKKSNGLFKANNMGITPNGQKNSPYFGVTHAMAAQSTEDTWFIMYTPNVRDFKFTLSSTKKGSQLVVKAYGRTEQYGKETEIPLIRTADIRPEDKGDGTPWYQFRVADRGSMAKNYEYIRIEIVNAVWTQCTSFTYFYDGPDPGAVPADERPHILDTVGTEREGVQTINAAKGNLRAEFLEHMSIAGNGGNAGFIGCSRGVLVYPDATKDGTAIFKTEGIDKFWVKFCVGTEELAKNLKVKFYVAATLDAPEEEWTAISAHIEACPDSRQPTGWKAIELVSDEGVVFPVGSNYLKIVIPAKPNNNAGTSVQIARIDFTYTIPEGEKLPAFATPDTENGEKELREDFSGSQILKDNGGLAEEAEGVEWMMQSLGTYNGTDKVYYKKDFADAYFVYYAPGITSIDVRGYRHETAIEDMLIYVSADGEEWTELTAFTRREVTLYGGLINYSHVVESVPAGMNYVRIMYPEFAGELTDITVSDLQILYDENVAVAAEPASVPWILIVALCAVVLAGAGVAVFLILRRRRAKPIQ